MTAFRVRTPRRLWTWSATRGLVAPDGSTRQGTTAAEPALDAAGRIDEPAVVVFTDLHPALGAGGRPAEPGVVRRLRDLAAAFRSGPVPRTLVLVSPVPHVPVELTKDVTVVDFPLPAEPEIRAVLDAMITANMGSGRIRADLVDTVRPWVGSTNQEFVLLSDRFPALLDELPRIPDRPRVALTRRGAVPQSSVWRDVRTVRAAFVDLLPLRNPLSQVVA